MILLDTNIWIDHLRSREPGVIDLLGRRQILMHPFVIGEVMLGSMAERDRVRQRLLELLPAPVAKPAIVLTLIEEAKLFGSRVGYVDAHLLASGLIAPGMLIWTRDKRLREQAERLGVSADLA